jgi:Zn-dependent peptidase ImmA (M78 family)
MVQIAINRALKVETPKYNKKKFEKAVDFALTQTKNHDGFLTEVKKAFEKAGVVLVVLPNLKSSGINGATKKVDGKVMIMVNDRRHYADTFWFTLFHEIGHVLNGDLGITFKNEAEDDANLYAQRSLIPEDAYVEFKNRNKSFTEEDIRSFADAIDQDPGIVYGRLQIDGKIPYTETYLSSRLRHKYKVVIA